MKNKILIINDVIILIISIFLSILGAKFINKPNDYSFPSTQADDNYFLQAYPIGSIYITTSSNENTPEKMKELHGGTWEPYGNGRLLQSNTSVEAGTTGGSNEVTLQVENIPSHSHNIPSLSVSSFTGSLGAKWYGFYVPSGITTMWGYYLYEPENIEPQTHSKESNITISGQATEPSVTENVGSGTAFNIQNEYITVYMWKRTE